MEIYQLRTFMAVAAEGSITRAAEILFLSQPAVSAHIKALEEELGLTLFTRTVKGMSLTPNGVRLYSKAEAMLSLHRDFLEEARRMKGKLSGRVRLGSARNPSARVLSRLLNGIASEYPEVDLLIKYGSSAEVIQGIRNGSLDAGLFVDAGSPLDDLASIELERFGIFLAAPPGLVPDSDEGDWSALAKLPWLCSNTSTCCGMVAETIFQANGFRPARIVNVDQESVTRTLIAGGVGIGLLHEEAALDAKEKKEVKLLSNAPQSHARLVFANLTVRGDEAIISALVSTVEMLANGAPTKP